MTKSNAFKSLIASITMALAFSSANANLIDFTTDTQGYKANNFTSSGNAGVHFSDTIGSDLQISNSWDYQAPFGNALGIFGDDPSKLQVTFDALANSFSLAYGNDDPCCSTSGDRAWLELWNGATKVSSISQILNRNDIMDQTISYSGVAFNKALFWYGNASGGAINLVELVDNIKYTPVPLPAAVWLFGSALAGLTGVSYKRRKQLSA